LIFVCKPFWDFARQSQGAIRTRCAKQLFVSISHTEHYAAVTAVLEG
jgi:phosphopantetheinyl transferase (holo-ACP synthase)